MATGKVAKTYLTRVYKRSGPLPLEWTATAWWFKLQECNCDWVTQGFLLHASYIRDLLRRCKWNIGSFTCLTFFNINTEPATLVKSKNQYWRDSLRFLGFHQVVGEYPLFILWFSHGPSPVVGNASFGSSWFTDSSCLYWYWQFWRGLIRNF